RHLDLPARFGGFPARGGGPGAVSPWGWPALHLGPGILRRPAGGKSSPWARCATRETGRQTGGAGADQPLDATLLKQWIRQYFRRETELFGSTRSKPSQDRVPGDLTWRVLLALVFNAMRARPECCVDPLKPPGEPDILGLVPYSKVANTYPCRRPITTFASVDAFTFFPFTIARIVLRSSAVALVVLRPPLAVISAFKLSFATTRPPS